MSNKYWADKTDGVDEIAAADFNLAFSNLEKDISSNIGGLKSHGTAEILDHPDGSVTEEKLADGSVTKLKLGEDLSGEIEGFSSDITALKKNLPTDAEYVTVNLGTAASELMDGLCKFTFKGCVETCQHNPAHSSVKDKYVPLQHTMGTLNITNDSQTESVFDIDLYGRGGSSTYGFVEARDELTEKYLKRVWSEDFFITSSYEYTVETPENNSNNRIHIFTVPEGAFGSELPKKTGTIEPVCNFAFPRSKEWIYSYTDNITISYGTGYYVAMEYDGEQSAYKIYFLTNNISKSTLLSPKLFIKYELNTPVYDYHTNKLYVKNGSVISFSQKSAEIFTTVKSTPSMSKVPLTSEIQAPVNVGAILKGFEQTCANINDLNQRVESIEVKSGHLGSSDGVTDDSDSIQNLINNAETASGHMTAVVIPEGVYALGKSIELTKSNLHLIGSGNVIFKPTGNFPAIKVYRPSGDTVEDIIIENIKIHLPNQAFSDGDFEGSHSGIYIDGSYAEMRGLYRINVKDVTVTGAYRYEWQDTDKSYAVYCKDNTLSETFAYFCNFENINAFSVYCGLYLGSKVNCSRVSGFCWDKADVNGYDGPIDATMGVAYGIICASSYNFIDFRGQSTGDDSGSWCYKDYDGGKYSLAEVIGSDNVNTVSGIDYFADGYSANRHEQVTAGGKTVDVFLARNNLSKAGVLCSGSFNRFSGHIYDPQRSDCQYFFTAASSHNRYYYPTAFYNGGVTHADNSFYVDLYGSGSKSDIIELDFEILKDLGYENICEDYSEAQQDSFVSDNFIKGADDEAEVYGHSKHFGMQDNALAYADKFAAVNVYQTNGETQSAVTVNGTDANSVIGAVFDPKSREAGFRNGITFDQSPSYDSPICIDIEFNEGTEITYLSRLGIQFNNYIGSHIEIFVKREGDETYGTWGIVSKAIYNKSPHFTLLAYMVASDGQIKTWEKVKAIRIRISRAYSTKAYNTDEKVGISLIWATDANHGGNAWLPRGGGRLYGDIDLGENYIKLGMVESLPAASKEYRGKQVILKDDENGDRLYTCIFNGSDFSWREL